jgi:hypothetical protein
MMINRTTNRVFMHNPKTAGTSLRVWLRNSLGYEDIVPNVRAPWDEHPNGMNPSGVIWMHAWVPPPDTFSWFVVRHPLERWVSGYRYWLRNIALPEERQMTFTEYSTTRLGCQPLQCEYQEHGTFWIKYEELTDGLAQLGYGSAIPTLPVLNKAPGPYVLWTREAFDAVVGFYREDFRRFGYLIPRL